MLSIHVSRSAESHWIPESCFFLLWWAPSLAAGLGPTMVMGRTSLTREHLPFQAAGRVSNRVSGPQSQYRSFRPTAILIALEAGVIACSYLEHGGYGSVQSGGEHATQGVTVRWVLFVE